MLLLASRPRADKNQAQNLIDLGHRRAERSALSHDPAHLHLLVLHRHLALDRVLDLRQTQDQGLDLHLPRAQAPDRLLDQYHSPTVSPNLGPAPLRDRSLPLRLHITRPRRVVQDLVLIQALWIPDRHRIIRLDQGHQVALKPLSPVRRDSTALMTNK